MRKMAHWMAAGVLVAAAVAGSACDSDSDGGTTGTDTTSGADTGGADTGVADTGVADTGGADTGVADTGGADTGQPGALRVATFNAGLAHGFVKYATERRTSVVTAIAALDADLVCLQEVWDLEDIQAVIDGTSSVFPHEFHVITDPGTDGTEPPACTAEEAGPLKTCVEDNCTGSNDLANCALGNCGAEFGATSPDCQTCMAANIGKNDIGAIFTACAEGSSKFSYEGRNGVLLLSRLPLQDTDHTVMDSTLVRRAVLYASVAADTGDAHVFCTHLTADLNDVPYQGEYTSWVKEQEHQVDQMSAWITTKAATGPILLLGDMNAGPSIPPDIDAESPTVYDKLVAAGFESPYLLNEPAVCTWCGANDLVDAASTNRIIDHVMLSGWGTPTTTAKRIMDQPVTIDVEGTPTTTNLSDHFGVEVLIED